VDYAYGARGTTQIRRTVLGPKKNGRNRSAAMTRTAVVWAVPAPGSVTFAMIGSDADRFDSLIAGTEAGLWGTRLAQHGCSAPQGMAGAIAATNNAGLNSGCTPGQHECFWVEEEPWAACDVMRMTGNHVNVPAAVPQESEPSITTAMILFFNIHVSTHLD
jgi:hypothetical protein